MEIIGTCGVKGEHEEFVEREVVGVIVVSEVAWLVFNDCVRLWCLRHVECSRVGESWM